MTPREEDERATEIEQLSRTSGLQQEKQDNLLKEAFESDIANANKAQTDIKWLLCAEGTAFDYDLATTRHRIETLLDSTNLEGRSDSPDVINDLSNKIDVLWTSIDRIKSSLIAEAEKEDRLIEMYVSPVAAGVDYYGEQVREARGALEKWTKGVNKLLQRIVDRKRKAQSIRAQINIHSTFVGTGSFVELDSEELDSEDPQSFEDEHKYVMSSSRISYMGVDTAINGIEFDMQPPGYVVGSKWSKHKYDDINGSIRFGLSCDTDMKYKSIRSPKFDSASAFVMAWENHGFVFNRKEFHGPSIGSFPSQGRYQTGTLVYYPREDGSSERFLNNVFQYRILFTRYLRETENQTQPKPVGNILELA